MTHWDEVAREKLTRVLGASVGEGVYVKLLKEMGLEQLDTVDDLYQFGQALTNMGGFTGAVGGLLGVHAMIHGASGQKGPGKGTPEGGE